MALQMAMPWSEGEHRMHELLHVPEHDNPTSSFLTPQAAYMLQRAPLLAVGTLDAKNRPWTTIWGGERGFSQPLGGNLMGTRTLVDVRYDPVVEALMEEQFGNAVGKGKMMAGLTIDLMTRKRVKLSGSAVAGAVAKVGDGEDEEEANGAVGHLQMVTKIDQSLGNCPKYLNKKEIHPAVPAPELLYSSPQLNDDGIKLLEKADLFFMSTSNADVDMDTNHRGGPPGFVRLISNNEDGAEIIYPEYSGNRLYQSLGNLLLTPLIGLALPDFDSGNVLYITGIAEILVGEQASKILPRTNLAVKIKVTEARFVKRGLPFKGLEGELSPYNPPVRVLASESKVTIQNNASAAKATLVEKTTITPTVSRYRFRAQGPIKYEPGQWVAMDFSEELDVGYSHMRDDDPQSLNDDFIRTFTVSSHPDSVPANEFEITTRLHGPVTEFISRQNVPRNALDVPLKGFGGDFVISTPPEGGTVPFIAGGVGITPLLGQLQSLDLKKLRLLWIVRLEDIDFVVNEFQRNACLAKSTEIFFTGSEESVRKDADATQNKIDIITQSGAQVKMGRPKAQDLLSIEAEKWYLCAGQALRKQLLEWLSGKVVVYENFDY